MMALGYDPNANTAPARLVGALPLRCSLRVAKTGQMKPAISPTQPVICSTEKLTRPMHGNRSNFSENANFRRPRIGAGSYRLRCREPINFARLRRPRPEPTNGPEQIDVLIKTSGALTDAQKVAGRNFGGSLVLHPRRT